MPKKRKIFLSTDCVGVYGKGEDWVEVWGESIEQLHGTERDVGMEILAFPGCIERFLPVVKLVDGLCGVHGRVGWDGTMGVAAWIRMSGFNGLMETESRSRDLFYEGKIWYWLVHGKRYWEKGVARELRSLCDEGNLVFVENGVNKGALETAVSAMEDLGSKGRIMIDIFHLFRELGGCVGAKGWEEKMLHVNEIIEHLLWDGARVGLHIGVGTNLSDSIDVDRIVNDGKTYILEDLGRILEKWEEKVEVVVIENQQKEADAWIRLSQVQKKKQAQRNLWVIKVLGECGVV